MTATTTTTTTTTTDTTAARFNFFRSDSVPRDLADVEWLLRDAAHVVHYIDASDSVVYADDKLRSAADKSCRNGDRAAAAARCVREAVGRVRAPWARR
jgi:hypothetical protein